MGSASRGGSSAADDDLSGAGSRDGGAPDFGPSPEARRRGDEYLLTPADLRTFAERGHLSLRGVLAQDEVAALRADAERFLRREIPVPGKDFCDMSGAYDRPLDEYAIVNVMLPRRWHPPWRGNPAERRGASIARQLCGPGMALDYDQLLAKHPFRADAVFAWHQDQAYWIDTPDPRTATLWLALDEATEANGCLRFVPGSQREPALRPHHPLHGDREQSHALVCEVDELRERIELVPLQPGDVSVHCERVIHGSGGNTTASWRRAYIVAFRSEATIAEERRRGFTHSHEDRPEVLARTAGAAPPTTP